MKTVHIKIINAHDIGYIAGETYFVEPEEAKRLVDAKKAEVIGDGPAKKETADAKTKAETADLK